MIPELASIPKVEPDWNIIVPVGAAVFGTLVVVVGFLFRIWDRIKKCFPDKLEFDFLKAEVHELRVRVATLEKQDNKLDNILAALERKRRTHE